MKLALTCFGAHGAGLKSHLSAAAELGFPGVAALAGDELRAEDLSRFPAEDRGRVSAAVWDCFLTESPPEDPNHQSSTQAEAWQRSGLRWQTVRKGLLKLGSKTLIVDPGLMVAPGAKERGERLVKTLQETGQPGHSDETMEPLRLMSEQTSEIQLEGLARFLFAIHRSAPGLEIALIAHESPAGIFRPKHLSMLQEDAGLSWLGYWHDSGRTQCRATFGLDQPGEWLDTAQSTLKGCTLHDWAEGQDLLLPGEGVVDFQLIAEYLPRTATRVLAAAPVYPMESLPLAREALMASGIL